MSPKILLKLCILVSAVLTLNSAESQTMYVLNQIWEVTKIDMQALTEVDSFEIIQQPPPLLEERGEMGFAEFVPAKNLLFVSNTEGGPTEGGPPGLKIMKVDLTTKTSAVFFRDQPDVPGSGTLMDDAGDYYYDTDDDFLYAHYYDIVYVLDKDGQIKNRFQDVPELALDQSYPRFGKKVYSLGAESLVEFDLTTCTERNVLTNLPWIGGDPYAVGTKKFFSQSETEADILIADRKTYRLNVHKSDPAGSDQWTINDQVQWFYVIDGEPSGDIPGYKRFDGELLTITPGQGDLTFWVFDPSKGPDMPLVYRVSMLPPHIIWHGVPDQPENKADPVARLVPGTNKVVATYGGLRRFDRFRLVVLDAATGKQLKIFDMYGGLAGLLFTQ